MAQIGIVSRRSTAALEAQSFEARELSSRADFRASPHSGKTYPSRAPGGGAKKRDSPSASQRDSGWHSCCSCIVHGSRPGKITEAHKPRLPDPIGHGASGRGLVPGLWRRGPRIRAATAPFQSSCGSERVRCERHGAARRNRRNHRKRHGNDEHGRDLERRQRESREQQCGDNFRGGDLHRAGRAAAAGDRNRHRNERGRYHEERERHADDYEQLHRCDFRAVHGGCRRICKLSGDADAGGRLESERDDQLERRGARLQRRNLRRDFGERRLSGAGERAIAKFDRHHSDAARGSFQSGDDDRDDTSERASHDFLRRPQACRSAAR